jgi:hypothetical protein
MTKAKNIALPVQVQQQMIDSFIHETKTISEMRRPRTLQPWHAPCGTGRLGQSTFGEQHCINRDMQLM